VEQNTMSFIDFPVSAIYNFHLIKNIYLATRLGLKIGWPLNNEYILQESDLYTRLYFEEWDLELFNIPAHGLYDSRTDWHPEGELNLNPAFSFFLK
jgi:OmpA-OmpF porin, OOP family